MAEGISRHQRTSCAMASNRKRNSGSVSEPAGVRLLDARKDFRLFGLKLGVSDQAGLFHLAQSLQRTDCVIFRRELRRLRRRRLLLSPE
jgi:hypothetical protein